MQLLYMYIFSGDVNLTNEVMFMDSITLIFITSKMLLSVIFQRYNRCVSQLLYHVTLLLTLHYRNVHTLSHLCKIR